MENANITTSVDVKLGHADMIEMLVEEQLENFENQLAAKSQELTTLATEEAAIRTKLEVSVTKDAKLDKRKDLKDLKAAAKLLGLTVSSKSSIVWNPVKEPFDQEGQVNFDHIESYKNPMTKYKEAKAKKPDGYNNGLRTKAYHHAIITDINTGFYASDKAKKEDKYGGTYEHTSVELSKRGASVKPAKPSAATKALYKKLEAITVKAANADKEKYAIKCQLFELENSGKRHKAKFLKAMLGNSAEGKSLLGLMKNVGGMNLLESGQK
jgi:hypothetical protein